MKEPPRLTAADDQQAVLDPFDVLAVLAGASDKELTVRVQRVLAYALDERVYPDAPTASEDEVLTVDFRHTFTRAEVAQLLTALTGG